jgi:hypothetical protein
MLSPGASASDYNMHEIRKWLATLATPPIDDAAHRILSVRVFDNARRQIMAVHHHHASSFMKAFISAII